jgi:hypothetical protein
MPHFTSCVSTSNFTNLLGAKVVEMATSVASRPRGAGTRQIRDQSVVQAVAATRFQSGTAGRP